MPFIGKKDGQTVVPGGARARSPNIDDVEIHELGNIITRSGFMTEIFRVDWPAMNITVRQINWAELGPGGITDWHAHAKQTDRLIGVGGNIKLVLWDGRESSPTKGATDVIRIGAVRPIVVIVPPGVWHALRNESGQPAGYINVADELFDYKNPDNWRLSKESKDIPNIL